MKSVGCGGGAVCSGPIQNVGALCLANTLSLKINGYNFGRG